MNNITSSLDTFQFINYESKLNPLLILINFQTHYIIIIPILIHIAYSYLLFKFKSINI